MCNAVFSIGFFFSASFFAFYQLKATSKAESVCVPLTHTSTLKTDQNRQTHKQHTHTSSRHTHTYTHPHTRLIVRFCCFRFGLLDAFSFISLANTFGITLCVEFKNILIVYWSVAYPTLPQKGTQPQVQMDYIQIYKSFSYLKKLSIGNLHIDSNIESNIELVVIK